MTDLSGTSTTVSVIDTSTNTVDAIVDVGGYPRGVAVNPTGSRVYVTNRYSVVDNDSNNVSVIATSTNSVVGTVNVGLSIYNVAFTPDGEKFMLRTVATTLLL